MGPLDIFGEITGGGTYEQLSPHTVAVEIFGENCLTLDVQALIQAKRAAGRPKDFESIAELESVLEERTKNSELEDNC